MDRSKIVLGPHRPEKRQVARQMRREMTSAERCLWQRLRGNRLGGFHFRRQQVIDGFIIDFYCHRAGLCVETDGPVHLSQDAEDQQRTVALEARGLRVIRFTNDEVLGETERVLGEILRVVRERVGDGET